MIRHGVQDIVFAGGGEELHWGMTCMFDAMGALSTKFNHDPERASRPYDADRDGFVIGAGGGMLVLEDLDRQGAARESADWSLRVTSTAPTWSRPRRRRGACMDMALGNGCARNDRVTYSTPGTQRRWAPLSNGIVPRSSAMRYRRCHRTKRSRDSPRAPSCTSDLLPADAAGRFMAASANIETSIAAEGFPIVRESRERVAYGDVHPASLRGNTPAWVCAG